uniref:Cytochrome P450 n=1 Tax=Mycena chlorophos TaxID=658473 RepID=A0ABQ0LJ30_MYCCL|nr:cytochrome P450 [Mycena chlorophos]
MWPLLRKWPGPRSRIVRDFHATVRRIGRQVLVRHKPVKMLDVGEGQADWSFIGLLIKALAEDPAGERRLSHKEVMTQINTWLFSGFETTAASLTWLLIELAKHREMQDRLRIELRQLPDDAEYSEIARLPYLHSVVYETLRLHPPIGTTTRIASQDDIIPLSAPISTKSGDLVNTLKIAKGTHVRVPIRPVNTAKEFWGPGAGTFDPERWWNISAEEDGEADVVGGGGSHSGSSGRIMHLAFGDGSRACIGAGVALALMKVVVFVLVRRYAFALPHGAQAQIQAVGEPVARPQVKTRTDSDPAGTAVMMGIRKLMG